jgi:hypothetical protein
VATKDALLLDVFVGNVVNMGNNVWELQTTYFRFNLKSGYR